MNKRELIDLIATKTDLTKTIATRALDALLDGIAVSLRKGDPVVLVNFGTFVVKQRASQETQNFMTGQKVKINAAKTVGFKAGTALKESIKK